MSLFDRLKSLGSKLGLLQMGPPPAGAVAEPSKIQTRKVSLDELTSEVRAEEVRMLAELPAELSVAFEKVFEAAQVAPPAHGWSIERLVELLRTEQYRGMARESAQKAVLGVLSAVKAEVEDVVRDALARDQALDKFEDFARKKMRDRGAARQRRIAETEEKIRSLKAEGARLEDENRTDEEQWKAWRDRKVAYEREMAWAIGFLMDKPVITTDPPGVP
jgi:hypothetical protein